LQVGTGERQAEATQKRLSISEEMFSIGWVAPAEDRQLLLAKGLIAKKGNKGRDILK